MAISDSDKAIAEGWHVHTHATLRREVALPTNEPYRKVVEASILRKCKINLVDQALTALARRA